MESGIIAGAWCLRGPLAAGGVWNVECLGNGNEFPPDLLQLAGGPVPLKEMHSSPQPSTASLIPPHSSNFLVKPIGPLAQMLDEATSSLTPLDPPSALPARNKLLAQAAAASLNVNLLTMTRKERRARMREEAAAAAAAAEAPAASVLKASTASLPIEEEPEPSANPFAEIINKRLRTQRKKLTKIEKYESTDKKDLLPEQVQAIEKKPACAALVKELDEIIKSYAAVELEEAKTAKQKRQAVAEAEAQKLRAVERELKVLPTLTYPLPEEHYAALNYFKLVMTGCDTNESFWFLDKSTFIDSAFSHLQKYLEASQEEIYPGVTYSQIDNIITSILTPPAVPKFGVDTEEAISPVLAEGEVPSDEIVESDVHTLVPEAAEQQQQRHVIPPVAPGISFFTPSQL
ncbi:hypothetical protein BDK51DRAFT_33943, partial [Blyttiomyces helicus]